MQVIPPKTRGATSPLDGFDARSTVRLDVVSHPYGACPAALEALQALPEEPFETLAMEFRNRLAAAYRAPSDAILLLDGVDDGLADIVSRACGPVIGFPPSASASMIASRKLSRQPPWIARSPGTGSTIEADAASDLPADGVAVLESPSDPLGAVLSAPEIVRLARACHMVVIDERHAEFAGISMLPLAIEFENIIVLRSFETWAGIQDPSCGWALASPRYVAAMELSGARPEPRAIAAAVATLDNLASVELTLKLLREERSRLYRFLRKLSFLEPMPSWGPFIAARVNFVPRAAVVDGLAAKGVHVHAPAQPGLERFIRISVGSRSAMERLRAGLLELAPGFVS